MLIVYLNRIEEGGVDMDKVELAGWPGCTVTTFGDRDSSTPGSEETGAFRVTEPMNPNLLSTVTVVVEEFPP